MSIDHEDDPSYIRFPHTPLTTLFSPYPHQYLFITSLDSRPADIGMHFNIYPSATDFSTDYWIPSLPGRLHVDKLDKIQALPQSIDADGVVLAPKDPCEGCR